jgi:hypothetical protein
LPSWPDAWRERWGRRANELAEQGLRWPLDEAQAFAEVAAELQGGPAPVTFRPGAIPDPERPSRPTWDELAKIRWGAAVGDPEPGIINDRPDPERRRLALEAPGRDLDPYARAEREAIQAEAREAELAAINDRSLKSPDGK